MRRGAEFRHQAGGVGLAGSGEGGVVGRGGSSGGKSRVDELLPLWLEERRDVVARKTYVADAALVRLVPTALGRLSVNAVTDRKVMRSLVHLTRSGLAEASVRR